MKENTVRQFIENVTRNMPTDWLTLTTHRLDIYNESRAKTDFLEQFEALFSANNFDNNALSNLPTAYDYIRLGHPLSTVLEWTIAKNNDLDPRAVISFSSKTTPILAVLRKNLFDNKKTQIVYTDSLPECFDIDTVRNVYGYQFTVEKVNSLDEIDAFEGSTIFLSNSNDLSEFNNNPNIDFQINFKENIGSVLLVSGNKNNPYISDIQHVRRRETIAMTPANCYTVIHQIIGLDSPIVASHSDAITTTVRETIANITASNVKCVVGSSGLSIQYAIMMGLVEHAQQHHTGKDIRIIVPPNCYGGTNDQARRVAACINGVSVMDLPVDGDNNMVQSIDTVLTQVAKDNAVPYIIAEIPTNPRVEVPDMNALKEVLSAARTTPDGSTAIAPVFILDQTFCPNIQFLEKSSWLSGVQTLSYVSGSKFPSGGKCTAGYSVANEKAAHLMKLIENHLQLCDNEATSLQMELLAEQMPSMLQRINDAYKNTREFVNFIEKVLPEAKINFVSEDLAKEGFTPSVFSLDLPTKGNSFEEKESHKRMLNDRLITMMIQQIPNESKYCVSYGQLKGCYWTIPATSTQGTTKETDKDYIARVSVSPNLDLEHHKAVLQEFIEKYIR